MGDARIDLAVRLVEERERLGYSQADMARMLEVSREGLRLYESGQRGIAAEFLAAAAGLGVDVQYVLSGVKSPNLQAVRDASGPKVQSFITGPVTTAIQVFENKGTYVNTVKHITTTVAEVKPGVEHIAEEQAAALLQLVGKVHEAEKALKERPKSPQAIWAALNAHCGVTRYRLIKATDFERARSYLHQWLGRLGSMASAPVKDGDVWRKRRYAYIKINSREHEAELTAYLKRNFKADSLSDLSNDELERVYRYVASRKTRKSPS